MTATPAAFRRPLLAWFAREKRDLPWRRRRDPYRVWLSEVMLQQTRVEAAIPYFERFLAAFPDVRALAAAPRDEVLRLWEGLGYYARARNLHEAAKRIVSGGFPETAEGWRLLPGIGRYTAGAIASLAFGAHEPVVDGNVRRVLARWFALSASPARTEARCWSLAGLLLPRGRAGEWNEALMELGARVCLPRNPRCEGCPVERHCAARAAGDPGRYPVRARRRPVPHLRVVAGLIERRGRYLLCRRPEGKMLGGLWEFPGGKVEKGEGEAAALVRELREELEIEVEAGPRLAAVEHTFSHFTMTLSLRRCRIAGGRLRAAEHGALAWAAPEAFGRYAMPAADRKLVKAVFGA